MLPRLCSPHPPQPPPPMGLSYGEQSLCRVPPSPVHPHEGAPMRSCCNSFRAILDIFELEIVYSLNFLIIIDLTHWRLEIFENNAFLDTFSLDMI